MYGRERRRTRKPPSPDWVRSDPMASSIRVLGLPRPASVLIHHRQSCFAVKCFLKFRHIRDYAIGPEFFRRVRIDRGAQPFGLVTRLSAPALAVADEESLVGRETIEWFQFLILRVFLPRHVGQEKAAEIGDIFAQRQ